MFTFLIGCSIGVLAAACIGAPFLLPWSLRVRYLAAAPMTDPVLGLAPGLRVEMRAVRLSAVECHRGELELVVHDLADPSTGRVTLAASTYTPGALAKLDAWLALRTPLLMLIDPEGVAVHGPDGALNNLRLLRARAR
jgi:hypothetical protein